MKNEYIKNYVDDSMNKGGCEIIDNKWQCETEYIIYTDFQFESSNGKKFTQSLVKFNLKENKLIIPYQHYDFLFRGYRYEKKGYGKHSTYEKIYNRMCYRYKGNIYCTCSKGKKNFGVVSLFFKNHSRLDVDLRDYAYHDNPFDDLCRIDVVLSNENEFIIGLKGLNNTILSFDLDDKKIEFYHRKKAESNIILGIFVMILFIMIIDLYRRYSNDPH